MHYKNELPNLRLQLSLFWYMISALWQKEHVDYKIKLLDRQKQARDLLLKTQELRVEREKIYNLNWFKKGGRFRGRPF